MLNWEFGSAGLKAEYYGTFCQPESDVSLVDGCEIASDGDPNIADGTVVCS